MSDAELQAILARAQQHKQSKTQNKNIEASSDPLHDLIENTVTKSNALSRAYYRFGLVEKRCMEALISELHPQRTDNQLQGVCLDAAAYANVYKVSQKTAYRDIGNAVEALAQRSITTGRSKGKSGKVIFTLMLKAEYKADEGKIECTFNPLIVPHLIGMREKFSSYPLKKAVEFSSSYTWRFYEILVSWAQAKSQTQGRFAGWIKNQSVDDLRGMLGVPDSYSWGKFDQKVLRVAMKELREKAQIAVFVERVKTSRKITHLNISFIEDEQIPMKLDAK